MPGVDVHDIGIVVPVYRVRVRPVDRHSARESLLEVPQLILQPCPGVTMKVR